MCNLRSGTNASWVDYQQPCARHAEKSWLFIRPVDRDIAGKSTVVPTGGDILPLTIGAESHESLKDGRGVYLHTGSTSTGSGTNEFMWTADQGYAMGAGIPLADGLARWDGRLLFSGCFGGDRNGNSVLDRGKRRRDERMRAIEVARYLIYDPRLTMTVR
jgi:hypothetical protein